MEKDSLPQRAEKNQPVIYYQEDEIDLYELFLILKRRWKIILLITGLFIIAGILYILLAKPIYTTSFIVKLPSIPAGNKEIILSSPEETKLIIDNLTDLIREKRYKKISKLLDIPDKTIMYISSVKANSVKKNERIIKITLDVYDPSYITPLTEKLINYMNNNKFVKERMALKKEEILYSLNELNQKISEIQSIKDEILRKLKRGDITDLGFNPLDMDEKIIKLKNTITSLKNQLKLLKGYEIAVEPVIPTKPAKPKKKITMVVAGTTGLFLGIFLAFFMEWIENAKKRRNTNDNNLPLQI